MAEYYVNPNPGYVSPSSVGPMSNMGPMSNAAAPMANMGPSNVAPAFVNAAPHVKKPLMDADAILVLFILLVIILRVCH